jgi:pimeloyl-[acyl-carrier protein] methyl ester esterase
MSAAADPRTAPLYREERGSGPPLVFWHGWGMNLRVFDALAGSLTDHHQCVLVDLPGHGRSPWRDGIDEAEQLRSLLDTLPAKSVLVGWSLGAQFALRAAEVAADRLRGLVLLHATPRFMNAPDWPWGFPAATVQEFAQHLARDSAGTIADFLDLQVRGSRDAAGIAARLRAALAAHGPALPAALAAGLRLLETSDLRAVAARVTLPTLIVSGQHDRITPPAASLALAELLGNTRHLKVPRAAHAAFLSHADEVREALLQFTSGLPAAS